MNMILSIAAGGAIGAVLRYLIYASEAVANNGLFPWGTLVVNILGSFFMGVLVILFAQTWNVSEEMKAFLTIGFLGAFTTFSAISFDIVTLWERQAYWQMIGYGSASVIFSIMGLVAGMIVTRHLVGS